MNVSYKWLKKYINLDLEPEEVSKTLTSIGLEIDGMEEIQTIKGGLAGLVVGQVLECEAHPDSDHLHVTKVDLGNGQEPVQIVCGAANCRKGLKTIVATIGTKLYDGDKEFTIKKSKLRGVESNGMLCAEDEIGVGNDHNGIIELPEDTKVGTLAKDYYHIESDAQFVVDITPNRIDAASHYGVARDLNAFFSIHKPGKYQLSKPDVSAFKVDNNSNPYKITVESDEACPRYTAVTISGVEVKESPEWLKEALQSIGIRSINNVVDVTNYVMMAMGQPLHAYDADQIAGKHVIVKTMPQGTKFTTLDGVERELDERDLMVCDENGPMCIAGVFGGENSGTTEKTKNVLLESAYFNPVLVRKTARRHGLSTDASFRFERGCDPNGCEYNLKLAALLIKEVAGGTISSEVIDLYPNPASPFPVDITFEKINSLTGKEISKDDIHTILKGLEINIVSEDANGMKLEVPTYRVDVQRDCDVIEDLLRIYGYDNIECSTTLHSSITYSPKINSFNIQNMISEQLTGCGFQEIMNNSLTKSSYYAELKSYPAENLVMLMNPLSSDLNCMRQTLLFGGLESIEHNIKRKSEDIKFYEFGNCDQFHPEKPAIADKPLIRYSEDFHLGIWITGNKTAQSWSAKQEKTTFYQLRAYVNNILARVGVGAKVKTVECTEDIFNYGLEVKNGNGKTLAKMGSVKKSILKNIDIDQEVFFADINWPNLMKEIENNKVLFYDIPKFPSVKRDLALLVDKSVTFAQIEQVALETEKKLLKSVSLFDVYEGANLIVGKKSYAIKFILQDEEKTLKDQQIDAIMNKLIENFKNKLGASIR